MKATMKTPFAIDILVASAQTFRHIYAKWIQPNSSTLNEFKDKSQSEAKSRKAMKDLASSHKKAKDDVTRCKKNNKTANILSYDKNNVDPYKAEINIRNKITHPEQDGRQLPKLKFYWLVCLFNFAIGFTTMLKLNDWLAIDKKELLKKIHKK